MKRWTIALASVTALIVVLIVLAVSFKSLAVRYAIRSYLISHGISMRYDLDHFSIDRVDLSNIVLEDKIRITKLQVQLKKGSFTPRLIQAEVDSLEIETLQRLLKKLSSDSNEPTNYSSLQQTCQTIKPLAVSVKLKTVFWRELEIPLNLEATQVPDKELSASFRGENKNIHLVGRWTVSCGEALALNLDSIKLTANSIDLKDWGVWQTVRWELPASQITVTSNNLVNFDLHASLDMTGEHKGKPLSASMDSLTVSQSAPLADWLSGTVVASAGGFHLRAPLDLSFAHLEVAPAREEEAIKIKYAFDGMNFKNTEKKEIVHGLKSSGTCKFLESYDCVGDIADLTKTVQLKATQVVYSPATTVIDVKLKPKSSALILGTGVGQVFPSLVKTITGGRGRVELSGHLHSTPKGWAGDLGVSTHKVSMSTAYGDFYDLTLQHNLLSYPELASSPQRSISIGELNAGAIFKNLRADYHLHSLEQLDIQNLKLDYEAAHIEVDPFTVFPLKKRMNNMQAHVFHYSLKSLLSLGLKDKVSATGTLSGPLNVSYDGKVPIVNGKLVADGSGSIQYRTGALQKPGIKLSDNPMDILYGYLYDFEYKTLSVDIKTDRKYKMDMILSTLGHNPEYLKGKPLKLNLNLEQNLLAAFRSMMLTYDLPNKIKEHLEKADTE